MQLEEFDPVKNAAKKRAEMMRHRVNTKLVTNARQASKSHLRDKMDSKIKAMFQKTIRGL